jgi:guanosine-3',5'-bis(diphosphate) 3'-pyrophosphohydrolase
MSDGRGELTLLLKATAFSADRHRRQRRKDIEASPYINHPLDVATLLASIGGVEDVATLVGAILHDTIEDTATTGDELEVSFGRTVRLLVEEVTDDKSLEKAERKRLQIEHAPSLSSAAKLIKLGDKISNVQEVITSPPADWSVQRRREYLEWAEQVVAGCRGTNEALERHFDDLLREGRAALADEA